MCTIYWGSVLRYYERVSALRSSYQAIAKCRCDYCHIHAMPNDAHVYLICFGGAVTKENRRITISGAVASYVQAALKLKGSWQGSNGESARYGVMPG